MASGPRAYGWVNWMAVGTFIRRELSREWRFFRYTVFGPALQAALFASVFLLAAGDTVLDFNGIGFLQFLVPGLVIAAAMQRAFESAAYSMMDDKLSGTLNDFISAPFSALEWLVSYTVSNFLVAALIGLSVWAVLSLFGTVYWPVDPVIMLVYLAIGSTAFTAAGILSSVISPKWDSLAAKETFILAPLLMLSGSFFPLTSVPENWRILFEVNPVFYLIDGFRFAMTGYQDAPALKGLAIIGITAAVLWGAALLVLTRGYKIKD